MSPIVKPSTTIGAEAYFHGVVTARGSLYVEGQVEGNIHEAQTVVIGRNGRVKGDVCAEHVVVSGSVEGDIVAHVELEINAGGKVMGDVRTAKIIIEEGAVFEGNCAMGEKAGAQARHRSSKAQESKAQEPAEHAEEEGQPLRS